MEQDPKHPKIKSWLDGLQQESWQLELVISGFSIFLLLGAANWYWALEYDLLLLQQEGDFFFVADVLYYSLRTALMALIGSLLVHVTLRGLWIAAIGLRSVSGDIDYDEFRYYKRFTNRLRRRMGSFDVYIERLERYCSVMFSFAFLLLFSLIGLAIYIFLVAATSEILFNLLGGAYGETFTTQAFPIAGLLLGFIYLVDFVTLGFIKRLRWVNRIYYPFYIFMGWITLAFLYRPLYYNLIDNRFGRRFVLAVPLSILLLTFVSSWHYEGKAFYPAYLRPDPVTIPNSFYDDSTTQPMKTGWRASLNSRYTQNNYVELFVPYIPINDDEILKIIDPKLEATREVGFYLEGIISSGNHLRTEGDNKALLAAFRQKYRLYLDGEEQDLAPRFFFHDQRQQSGLLYPIPVHELPVGEHLVRLDRRKFLRDTVAYNRGNELIFYK